MKNKWYQAKVIHGKNIGKKLGFPTLNLDRPSILTGYEKGVYLVKVKIVNNLYDGLLYFGPRLLLGEAENILEIFVFDFKEEIYGQTISFKLIKYIREVINFSDTKTYQKQLTLDCQKAREILK